MTQSLPHLALPHLGTAALVAAACVLLPAAVSAQAHPDFSGIWGGGVAQLTPTTCKTSIDAFPPRGGEERFKAAGATGTQQYITFEQDCAIAHRGQVSKPQYKPEYWERVQLSDYHANAGGKWIDYADPEWKNLPRGLPRIGPPNKILQTADEVVFLYEYQNTFRVAPTDCREHDPVLKFDQTFYGLAVGCWEGDTLVVTSLGFTDQTWLDWPGYFHSAEMKVTERFRREGDMLLYTATVDDPVMLLEPWVMPTRRLRLNKTPGVQLMQGPIRITRSESWSIRKTAADRAHACNGGACPVRAAGPAAKTKAGPAVTLVPSRRVPVSILPRPFGATRCPSS